MSGYVTKDSGQRATFESGMQRDTQEGKARFDLLIPQGVPYAAQFLTRCAELMARGAEKYNDRNWEKANSYEELERFKSSALRHCFQWVMGETDEDHAAAAFYNIQAHESIKYKLERRKQRFYNEFPFSDEVCHLHDIDAGGNCRDEDCNYSSEVSCFCYECNS